MDRELLGVLGIAIVCGTVLTLLAIPGRDPIMVTGIRYPKTMERSNDQYPFSISMVATRDVEEVEIRIRTLSGFSPKSFGLENTTRKDLNDLENYPPLVLLGKAASSLGVEVEPKETSLRSGSVTYDLVYYDFFPVFLALLRSKEDQLLYQATMCYGFLHDGDRLNMTFQGGAELFPDELETVTEILVEVDGAIYSRWVRGEPPKFRSGQAVIQRVLKGKKVDVIYYIDGRTVSGGPLLTLVQILAEGELIHRSQYLTNV